MWHALESDSFEIRAPKGPVLATATVAGVMGAKRTSELVPFCHPVALDDCQVRFESAGAGAARRLRVECAVRVSHKTGVEMEALAGASAAALCVYDMCKALSHDIVIEELRLEAKSGGKRLFDRRAQAAESAQDAASS